MHFSECQQQICVWNQAFMQKDFKGKDVWLFVIFYSYLTCFVVLNCVFVSFGAGTAFDTANKNIGFLKLSVFCIILLGNILNNTFTSVNLTLNIRHQTTGLLGIKRNPQR